VRLGRPRMSECELCGAGIPHTHTPGKLNYESPEPPKAPLAVCPKCDGTGMVGNRHCGACMARYGDEVVGPRRLGYDFEPRLSDLFPEAQRRYRLGGKWEELKARFSNQTDYESWMAHELRAKMESMEREAE
jgi:hypothetical protein